MPDSGKINLFFERISSPISGTFLISWLLWNWEVLFYSFSANLDTHQKIYLIYNSLNWSSCIWLPLVSTVSYLILMPLFLEFYGVVQDFYEKLKKKRESRLQLKLVLISRYEYENRYSLIDLLTKCLRTHEIRISNLDEGLFRLLKLPHTDTIASINYYLNDLKSASGKQVEEINKLLAENNKIVEIIKTNNSATIFDEFLAFSKEFAKEYEGKKF